MYKMHFLMGILTDTPTGSTLKVGEPILRSVCMSLLLNLGMWPLAFRLHRTHASVSASWPPLSGRECYQPKSSTWIKAYEILWTSAVAWLADIRKMIVGGYSVQVRC